MKKVNKKPSKAMLQYLALLLKGNPGLDVSRVIEG